MSGLFPSVWKISYAIPVHKNGRKDVVNNYRNIAKLSFIPKLFESLLLHHISFYLKTLIHCNQHGFMPNRSTMNNLVHFTSKCLNSFEKHHQVDCIFTDFSKAFDRNNHDLLIFKLDCLGFPLDFLVWLKSYLNNRIQVVVFSKCVSSTIPVTSGVPQGSHLGPFLFVLFINDVVNVIKSSDILLYADDIKIFRNVNNVNDALLLQYDLAAFHHWCEENCMSLNIDKCKSMSFFRKNNVVSFTYHINGIALTKIDGTVDLGVHLDSKLNFYNHIDIILSKANSMLGFIKRWTKDFDDPYVLKTLFVLFVRSVLEYCAVVWNPMYAMYVNRIESVQRKFIKFALRKLPWSDPYNLPSYENRLQLFSMCSLQHRRSMLQSCFIVKLLSGQIDSPDLLSSVGMNVFRYITRINSNSEFLHTGFHRTNYGANEPITAASRTFNTFYYLIDFNVNFNNLKYNILNIK